MFGLRRETKIGLSASDLSIQPWLATNRPQKCHSLLIDPNDTPTASETIIPTTVVDCAYADLTQSGRAHDAGLDRHI